MCTLIFLRGVIEGAPMIIAANRDEFYRRQATAPQRLSPNILAGIDVPTSGTWLGVTRDGLFVGLTNQRTGNFSRGARSSRGRVVRHCLELGRTDLITAYLNTLNPSDYNPFNLAFGTAEEMKVAYCRSEKANLEMTDVPMGVSVLANDALNSPRFQKVARARQLLEGANSETVWTQLEALLGDHEKPKLHAVPWSQPGSKMPRLLARQLDSLCVHAGVYGTRSSAIVGLRPDGIERFLWSDGPACRARYRRLRS